jgi:hypothetical protein
MAINLGLEIPEIHEAIHNSVMADLEAAMRLLHHALSCEKPGESYELAGAILEIWTERVLWHNQVEEAELYRQVPALRPLHRDHDLMAQWVGEAFDGLEQDGCVSSLVMARLEALLVLLHTHNNHALRQLRNHPHLLEESNTYPFSSDIS